VNLLARALVPQFQRPSGLLGRVAGFLMANRPSNRRRSRWTIDLVDPKPDDTVFELGCGPGYALSLAASRVPSGTAIGIDHSATMIAMASSRLRRLVKTGRVSLSQGTEHRLADFTGTLGVIYSANVVQFLADRAGYFRLAHDALAPGGRIATTYQPRTGNPTRAKADRFAETCIMAMRDAGFEAISKEWLETSDVPTVCVLGRKPA